MASTKYNVVYRSGAAVNSPVPSYYTCGTVAEISGAVAGDLAYETTNDRVMKYNGSAWTFLVPTPPFAKTDTNNQFSQSQTISLANPLIVLNDTAQPADQRVFFIQNTSQLWLFRSATDNFATQTNLLILNRAGDCQVGRDIYEKGRANALGRWITVPFSASNFFPGGGTWTVTAGQVQRNRYMLIGNSMCWQLRITGSTLSVANQYLYMVTPGGAAAVAGNGSGRVSYVMSAGVVIGTAFTEMDPGSGALLLNLPAGQTFAAGTLDFHFTTWIETP